MKFDYVRPSSIEELTKYLNEGGKIFSGGTDVFVKLRAGLISPKILVDSKQIVNKPITLGKDKLIIYINNTYSEFLENEEIVSKFPVVGKIISSIGSTQIRNKGTMVGNIANASPAGDFLLASYLYDAIINLKPTNRSLSVEEFVKGPGKIDLKENEFIYSVELPYLEGYNFYYEKLGRRNEMVISIASIGVLIKIDNDSLIKDMRIAFGSVGPTIVRFKDIEKASIGKKFSKELFEEIAEKYFERIHPIDDVRGSATYRKKMVKNLLIKSYHKLAGDYK